MGQEMSKKIQMQVEIMYKKQAKVKKQPLKYEEK